MRYCETRSAPFAIESCCGSTSRCSSDPTWPACANCSQVPTIQETDPAMGVSLCLRSAGHRGKHSWAS